MLPAERQAEVLKYIQRKKAVKTEDLSKHFDVHEATIRRDLTYLEQEKKIKRTHGGVILNEEVFSEPHFDERESSFFEEKGRIGEKAASFINDGDSIILDSGTTTKQIAEAIKNRRNLTVITNDIHIAALLTRSSIKVIVTGGVLFPENFILNGEITNQTLLNLNVTKAFIATPALHPEKGLTHFDDALISAKKSMIRAAKEIFVVTDHSKLGKLSLFTFGEMAKINHIITDDKISEEMESALKEHCDHVWIV
ncbi:DeoR/GlpR family DNA-binding transcription regulator [Sporosarcina jiandibaonis]|uniref:DeoR/GlpR family DNA-binding transcription regulator n=1 Tax=Sporosarcina jiandibaonis TaxID=2715535 RepID=UPI001557422D|nr:DeoR/GlpR family DNA-binding transcription regulator [Sporosarcina jiandibaonis]